MRLYCKTIKPSSSNWLPRVLRLADDSAATHMVELLLTEPESHDMLDSDVLGQVFGSIVDRLAEDRPIRILFPQRHSAEIKRSLKKMQLQLTEEKGLLWMDVGSQDPQLLIQILEATSFSDSYAEVGSDALSQDLDPLFEHMEDRYFVASFHLFDEHMRIFSEFVSVEAVKKAAREFGEETGLELLME
jgi:hypothetical protein